MNLVEAFAHEYFSIFFVHLKVKVHYIWDISSRLAPKKFTLDKRTQFNVTKCMRKFIRIMNMPSSLIKNPS